MIKYIPMISNSGIITPDWEAEPASTPSRALIENVDYVYDNMMKLCMEGSITVAEIEETADHPPEEVIADMGGHYTPGDTWFRWIGCVKLSIVEQEVSKTCIKKL